MIGWVQKQSIALRLCFAFAYCGAVYALPFALGVTATSASSLVLLTVFPLFYGTAIQLVFDPQVTRPVALVLLWGIAPVALLCVGLLIVQFETLICVAIILPIFVVLMLLGQLTMRALLRRALVNAHNNVVNVSVLMLPVLAMPLFGASGFPLAEMRVQTQMLIAAPADVVWANTYEIAEIEPEERVWTFSHNVLRTPLPIDATVKGTVRQLRWSGGIRFQEHLKDMVQNESMAWDFVFDEMETLEAFDPRVAPQGSIVNMHSGSYVLTEMPNGDTLLTLETKYSIQTPVNAYLALWGEVFLQDFHHAVLSVIRNRSEAKI